MLAAVNEAEMMAMGNPTTPHDLREARREGDLLIVAVNADEQVRAQKGEGRPIYELRDRLEILAELQSVMAEMDTLGNLVGN